MASEKHTCSLHDEDGTVVKETTVFIEGLPGITEWSGTIGPMDEDLEIGLRYRLRLEDESDGLIVIARKMRNWGGATGNRFEFKGVGALK